MKILPFFFKYFSTVSFWMQLYRDIKDIIIFFIEHPLGSIIGTFYIASTLLLVYGLMTKIGIDPYHQQAITVLLVLFFILLRNFLNSYLHNDEEQCHNNIAYC